MNHHRAVTGIVGTGVLEFEAFGKVVVHLNCSEEVSVRKPGEGDLGSMKIATFAGRIADEVRAQTNQ